jgi:ABC-type polysaccharide/polyol phosphate transport system ATPase subunit
VNAVEFQGVSKRYAIYDSPDRRLTELLSLNRLKRHRDFLALDDVAFAVERGQTFCIIGQNGSGKSTLLQIVAGILQASAGTATVNGRVSALLELGAGFNPEFTGRENVYLYGSILGLSARQLDERYPEIAAFAEIGEFILQPVKTYSSGMVVRLAFAVAIHVDPEILLVDEALAVGDAGFRRRCLRKVNELRARGVTILFVSHSIGDVRAIGDRAMWLDRGRVADLGDPDRVAARYLAAMVEKDSGYLQRSGAGQRGETRSAQRVPRIVDSIPHMDRRHGNGRAEVLGIGVFDEGGWPAPRLEPRTRILVRISARAKDQVALPVVGFVLRNQLGADFSGTDTRREGCSLAPLGPGEICTADFYIDLPELYPASFSFSPFVADGAPDGEGVCDWIDNAAAFEMGRSESRIYGYMQLPCRVEVNARLRGGAAAEVPVG